MNAEKPPYHVYRFDRFVLDVNREALLRPDGAELQLKPKSFALLRLLVENAGRPLDRDMIMQAVWPDVSVTGDQIEQCVGDILRVLGDDARHLLRAVPHKGYLLTAEVSSMEPEGTPDLHGWGGQEPSPGSERRHLTVLVCDLVDSTGLSERMDPEDATTIMHAFMERCTAVITECGGHIANYTGDGLMAYFGYPYAREDAAERSVRAGLALVEAVGTLDAGPDVALMVRVGIATGLVVNDQIAEGTQAHLAVGRPLNLAARLQALATPGSVVLADTTRCLLGGLFAVDDLGSLTLKGFTEPVRAWRVIGEGVAESRFEALRGTSIAPLVDRGSELSLLLDRWRQAREGEGQMVLLVGEPGIGKSRLIQALRDALADEPHTCCGYYCSPFHQESPLWPVIAQLGRAAKLARGDDPVQKLAKIEALLAQGGDDTARSVPLIASLLSVPTEGRYPPLDMPPQQQRERTLAAVVDQFAGLAAHRPLLLIWEDTHWADPTSLELLRIALDRLQGLPVLTVVSFRPEFSPPWPGTAHATWLGLSRLGRERCGELITGVSGGKALPAEVLDRIMDKAEGVPLFVEELTRTVLESALLRDEGDHYALEGPLPPMAIPETLQDSLMARLDRHAPVRELVQLGAVIGREFSHELLAAIASWGERELTQALRRLVSAELIFLRSAGSEATYVFKHALVRDAAYSSLLKGKRRQLHARIARVLEERFPQVTETEPDVLARHWTYAGDAGKAALYRLKAGERALARSATAEAVAQLTMGRDILQGLAPGPERHGRELDLQIALGAALSAAKGLAAPEAEQAYTQARELCGKLGEERRLVPVLLGLWASHNARDDLGAAHDVAVQLLDLARRKQNGVAGMLGHRALGATLFGLGRFVEARDHLRELVSLDDPLAGHSPASFPYDPYVSGRAWLALTLAVLGYPEQALAQSEKALADAARLRHHNTTCVVLSQRCSLSQFLRDRKDLAVHADALYAVALEQDFPYWKGFGLYLQGWVEGWAGETRSGIAKMEQGLAVCQSTGTLSYVPYNLAMLADMYQQAKDVKQSRKLLDMALDRFSRTDARYCEAELFRIEGQLRLTMTPRDLDGAEAAFKRAVGIAHDQEAKAVELRAAMSLARLWAGQGRRRDARDLLAQVYGWFTEGFATTLLTEARQLIDELR
jgi:class 3 adenylate cyclase/predicted ATPase